jgi:signal transduction protein with GAF and PtsI domain
MENVDIFKEMDATEIERILNYFDKLKSFFDNNDDYIQHINSKIKAEKTDMKPIDPQEMWAINDLLKYVKKIGFDHLEAFQEVNDAKDIYQELNFLAREGRFVSSIFRKYKQKIAHSLLEDTSEIVETYRHLAKENPNDKKIQANLKKLETEYSFLQKSVVFDANILNTLNKISK